MLLQKNATRMDMTPYLTFDIDLGATLDLGITPVGHRRMVLAEQEFDVPNESMLSAADPRPFAGLVA